MLLIPTATHNTPVYVGDGEVVPAPGDGDPGVGGVGQHGPAPHPVGVPHPAPNLDTGNKLKLLDTNTLRWQLYSDMNSISFLLALIL